MGQPIYEKSAINLLKDYAQQHFASGNDSFYFDDVKKWVSVNYPNLPDERIKTNLTILSTNSPARRRHSVHLNSSNAVLFAQVDGSYRAFTAGKDPAPLTAKEPIDSMSSPPQVTAIPERWKFEQERVLQSYLVQNLSTIEQGLVLHQEAGASGIEYPCGNRRIDILARDERGGWVVIELKADKAHDRVVGQINLYMQWVKANAASPKEQVRGVILAHHATPELRLAAKGIPGLSLKEYNLTVDLQDC